jgi:hypothetical protein
MQAREAPDFKEGLDMQATKIYATFPVSRQLLVLVGALLTGLLIVSVYVVFRANYVVSPTSVHVISGQPDASVPGSAWNFNSRQHGTQSVEGPAGATSAVAAREPSSRRSGPQLVP